MSVAKKVIKPLTNEDLDVNKIVISSVKTNSEYNLRFVDLKYKNADKEEKLLLVARGCCIKTTKILNNDNKNDPKKIRYQLFLSIKDTNFIECINKINKLVMEDKLKDKYSEWTDNKFACEEIKLKDTILVNQIHGNGMSCILARDFICKSKIPEITDTSNINILKKGLIIDVCFNFNKLKFILDEIKLGFEISQINIIGIDKEEEEGKCINLNEYIPENITLSELETNTNSGKFCKVKYYNTTFRFKIDNKVGRLIKSVDKSNPDKINYSLAIKVNDEEFKKKIELIYNDIFQQLFKNSEKYMNKKSPKIQTFKKFVRSLLSYSKEDQKLIENNNQPKYSPTFWVKIYYDKDSTDPTKIYLNGSKEPVKNYNDLEGKDLNFNLIDVYCRHVWLKEEATINFTLNKCIITNQNEELNMDEDTELDNTNDDNSTKSENSDDPEPVNSDIE